MNDRRMVATGAILGGLAVGLGAFGAHGLAEQLAADGQTENYHTAVRYLMWHALALVLCGALASHVRTRVAAWCFAVGAVIFSGTLFGIALSGIRWLGAITPIGGTLLIAGWVALAAAASRR